MSQVPLDVQLDFPVKPAQASLCGNVIFGTREKVNGPSPCMWVSESDISPKWVGIGPLRSLHCSSFVPKEGHPTTTSCLLCRALLPQTLRKSPLLEGFQLFPWLVFVTNRSPPQPPRHSAASTPPGTAAAVPTPPGAEGSATAATPG